eukprot:COSAG02_NODE_586_length_19960_cov_13.442118_13_plen_57_part_00
MATVAPLTSDLASCVTSLQYVDNSLWRIADADGAALSTLKLRRFHRGVDTSVYTCS